jgi:hypothetical protein
MRMLRAAICRVRLTVVISLVTTVGVSLATAQHGQHAGSAANVPGPLSAATSPAGIAPSSSVPTASGKPAERLREGTRLVDVPGSFASIGADRVTFSPAGGKDAYRVLENLALQRVGQSLEENQGLRQWIVSGIITEYRGSNYLLVTKAVTDSAASP